jgi:hypothetical protein
MLRTSKGTIATCSVAFLTACSFTPALHQAASLPDGRPLRVSATAASWRNVYLINQPRNGNGYISVYTNGTSHLAYKLEAGMTDAAAVIFDPSGNAYVYNGPSGTNCIIVFAAGTKKRLYTINGSADFLGSPAIDRLGNLYVPIGGQIVVYGSGTKKIIRKIGTDRKSAISMAFDSQDNLYASFLDPAKIVEFAAGSSTPIRTLRNGFEYPGQMLLDGSDNLYVLNNDGHNYYSIIIFAPNATLPTLTITDGTSNARQMAFDSRGDLFVLNTGDITAYKPGTTKPYLTFARTTADPYSMAIDAADNLYVANYKKGPFGTGSFKVFALGSNKLVRKVGRDVALPSSVSIGP